MPPSRRSTRGGGSGAGAGVTTNAPKANANANAGRNPPTTSNASSEKKDEVARVVNGMKFTSGDAAELHGLLASSGKGATGGTKSKLGLVRADI